MQIVIDLAAQFDRKVAFVGRGVVENSEIAQRLGYLRIPAGVQIRDGDVRNYPAHEWCALHGIAGGAEVRAPADSDRRPPAREARPEDVVVFSARAIPGNEKAIGRVMNHMARRGADVIYEGIKHVHVSGHGSEEELKLMLSLVRPRYFVPIHGEYRQLARHAAVAERGTGDPRVLVARTGTSCGSTRRGPSDGRGADWPGAHRRHAHGRDGQRGAARSSSPGGRGLVVLALVDQPSARTSRALRTSSRAASSWTNGRRRSSDAVAALPGIIGAASVEERADHGLIRERVRVSTCSGCSTTLRTTAAHPASDHGDLTVSGSTRFPTASASSWVWPSSGWP